MYFFFTDFEKNRNTFHGVLNTDFPYRIESGTDSIINMRRNMGRGKKKDWKGK